MSWVRTEVTRAAWEAETGSSGDLLNWPVTRWRCEANGRLFTLTLELMDDDQSLAGFGKVMVRGGTLDEPGQLHFGKGFWVEPNRAERTLALALEEGWAWLESYGAPARPEGWAS